MSDLICCFAALKGEAIFITATSPRVIIVDVPLSVVLGGIFEGCCRIVGAGRDGLIPSRATVRAQARAAATPACRCNLCVPRRLQETQSLHRHQSEQYRIV